MPRMSFQTVLSKLMAERQAHIDALAELDALFAKFGLSTAAPVQRLGRKPGRKPGPKPTKRKRGHFDQTAEEFVLGLLKGTTLATSEINAKWKEAGRGSTADTTLSHLTKGKKVKRTKVKNGQGSEYRAV